MARDEGAGAGLGGEEGGVALVEAEPGLARAGVEPVAIEAIRREDGAHVAPEVGRVGGATGGGGGRECEEEMPWREARHRRPLRPNMNCGRMRWVVWGRPYPNCVSRSGCMRTLFTSR